MGKQPMLNEIVLGTIRWVVGDTDFEAQFIGQPLQVFFEDVMLRTIAPPAITQTQKCARLGVSRLSKASPPIPNTITGKLAGIFTKPQMQIAEIVVQIVNPMRNDHPFRPHPLCVVWVQRARLLATLSIRSARD